MVETMAQAFEVTFRQNEKKKLEKKVRWRDTVKNMYTCSVYGTTDGVGVEYYGNKSQ